MCHLVLLLPVLALPLFWLVPVSLAAPACALVVVLSGWIYWLAISAIRQPVQTGAEALAHNTGEVIAREDGVLHVRIHSEIWNAESADALQPGDRIEVTGVEAMRLRLRRISETGSLGAASCWHLVPGANPVSRGAPATGRTRRARAGDVCFRSRGVRLRSLVTVQKAACARPVLRRVSGRYTRGWQAPGSGRQTERSTSIAEGEK